MKIGIVGLANCGKTTVFNALTGQDAPVTEYGSAGETSHVGVVRVPDRRVEDLAAIFEPRKVTFATVEYLDEAGIVRGDGARNRRILDTVRDVDALLHVVRGFEDEAVAHPLGGVDPLRDAGIVELELVFADLELVEKRLERMEEGAKKGRKPDEAERSVLLRCREALEEEVPLRRVSLSEAEQAAVRHLQFISVKPEMVVLNTGEDRPAQGREELLRSLAETCSCPSLEVPGKIEMEISQLSPEEAQLFLDDLGLGRSALDRVVRLCYRHLGLVSFLTVGKDEVRAWTIREGTAAVKAAGKVHSDIERGFIRAEVVAYEDFVSAGSMAAAKEKGKVRQEGKQYVVQDGDIINFRFNV